MSFEIGNVQWSPIDIVTKEDLQPILSTLSDFKLADEVIRNVGLEKKAYFGLDNPYRSCREFKHGRLVTASAIDLRFVQEILPTAESPTRWFEVGQHILALFGQSQETCGGIRQQAGAKIFSPSLR